MALTAYIFTDSIEEARWSQDTVYCKKVPKHIKEIFFDDDLGPDTQYAVVRLEHKDIHCTRLKGKIDKKKLHSSNVKLTGYGGNRFHNHGKFRVDNIHSNGFTGRRVEFFVSDFGSNIFSLRFCKALKILKILCDQPGSCNDCHGDFDISETGEQKKPCGDKKNQGNNGPVGDQQMEKPYSLEVKDPIPVTSTEQLIKYAKDVFTGNGTLKDYYYKIEVDESVPPVVSPPRRVPEKVKAQLKEELDKMEADGIIERTRQPLG